MTRLAFALLLALALAACGHKSGLYLPKDKPPANRPQPPAEPAPASPTGESQ